MIASDGAAGDWFGGSVSISNDRVIVGAAGDDDNSGSAYIYDKNSSGEWIETKLTASDGIAGDVFGKSVSISGDQVIVGAFRDNDAGEFSGSAYIYKYNSTGQWVETKLTASDGAAGDQFGWSVSISGDQVIVGAIGANSGAGSAYIYGVLTAA